MSLAQVSIIFKEMREWKLNFLVCSSAFWLNLKPILLRSFQPYKATLQYQKVKYRGLILRVMWPALGSYDLNLDQSGTSIQTLLEPKAGHVTHFYKITTLTLVARILAAQVFNFPKNLTVMQSYFNFSYCGYQLHNCNIIIMAWFACKLIKKKKWCNIWYLYTQTKYEVFSKAYLIEMICKICVFTIDNRVWCWPSLTSFGHPYMTSSFFPDYLTNLSPLVNFFTSVH